MNSGGMYSALASITAVCGMRRQFLLNVLVDPSLGEFGRYANRILDGVRVRRSVRDEAHALDSQQRRAAVLGVVKPFFEVGKGAARKQAPDLPGDGGAQVFLSA